MNITILDCYTDEPAGLGVPPYLGTYPRYIYGYYKSKDIDPKYITIDDLRKINFAYKQTRKTNIRIYNATNNNTEKILAQTETLIVILGVHVPGKYLSAIPGTIREITPILSKLKCKIILTGPAVFGTQLEGGKFSETINYNTKQFGFEFGTFDKLQEYAINGVSLIRQIPDKRIIEIETGRGCNVGKCSFCTEPLKNMFVNRKTEHILEEINQYYKLGCRYFRLGKQSDFYSIEDPITLLKSIRRDCPDIKVLHIDNVNPVFVINKRGIEITKAIVDYCSSGNVAAFGVESFDSTVVKDNTLNCKPNVAMKAIEIINEYGRNVGENGMPKFLPGINIIFGLKNESKLTHELNMEALNNILINNLLLRRINIRQVAILPGTKLEEVGNKFLKKNKKYYWKWRNDIRQNIDYPMLKKVIPKGTILKNIYTEVHDGNTTFARHFGTYPIIVGIKEKLPLKKFIDVNVTDHMLRSVTGVINKTQKKLSQAD